jgi:molybdopterin molybdotransferase
MSSAGTGWSAVRAVADQLRRVLASVGPLRPFSRTLLDAGGCLLAADAVAAYDLPPFTNSAMDGYAVYAADVAGASAEHPVTLPVVGEIAAGSTSAYGLAPGQTMRIMTGAPLPGGADLVVPQEWTDQGVARVAIARGAPAGTYVREAGSDVAAGTTVAAAGTWLDARAIGLLAAAGFPQVLAQPRPRVVVLSTGSELHEPGTSLGGGQIADSNSYMLATAATEAGAIAYRVPYVRDDAAELTDVLSDQLVRADLVITTGGVSVGAYDIARDVLPTLGSVEFTKVAMQPGMPQGFGLIGEDRIPVFALPGNPVSAYVSFEVFARPAIRRLAARADLYRPTVRVRLAADIDSPPGRTQFLRARLQDGVATTSAASSHLLAGLAAADALVIVAADRTRVPAGTEVDAMLLTGSARTTPLLPPRPPSSGVSGTPG